ncbi:MAG: hypothetical protein QOG68_515 [Solirubrobacteraceae bacterium]|nr:hypothetical protein [Solirubrobacteraceae bacterium]
MLRRLRHTRLRRDERGTTLVEFALVLPVLALILFAILQFGLLFYNYIDLTSAARDGARVAAVSRSTADGVGAVKTAIANATTGITDSQMSISVTPAQPWKAGDTVTVHVTYPYSLNIMGMVVWSGPMTADAIVRIE